MRFQLTCCIKPNMQTVSAKKFPVACCVKLKMNVLVEIISLKTRKFVNSNRLKTNFKNLSKNTALSKNENLSKSQT